MRRDARISTARRVRRGLVWVGLAAASLVAVPVDDAAVHAAATATPRAPNVLLVITDDQREGRAMMPATQKYLVDRGTRFSRAFATTPSCCPSRASIFTGRYSHNHGVVDNMSAERLDVQTTIQYYLSQNGYRTGIVGKYLNGWHELEDEQPSYFDDWAVLSSLYDKYYYDGVWNIQGDSRKPRAYSTTLIRRWSINFLEQWEEDRDRKPWFLTVAPTAPHFPYTAHPRYEDASVPRFKVRVEKNRTDKPPYVQAKYRSPRRGRQIRRNQFQTLPSVDDMIERVFEELNESGEARNTLVFFISDNAMLWGEHGLTKKGVPYSESIQVPLFMRWPGRVARAAVDDRLVLNIDLAPTILDAAGVADAARSRMDGRSLLDDSERNRILLEYLSDAKSPGPWASTRTADYQYVEYYGDDGTTVDFREYYDLVVDPYQMVNLFGDADHTNDPDPVTSAFLAVHLQADLDCEGEECP